MNADNTTTGSNQQDYDLQNYDPEDITVADASSLSQTITGTAIGNFTEWFDFGVYSYIIPVISNEFFPEHSSLATVAAFAALAVSFLVRPIGGFIWGILGDRIGRKKVLAHTVLLMAFGTFALGLVPGYVTIGIWAPVLLFVLRGIQGFSTGGEYVGAMTFLAEHAPDKKRGQVCSFLPVGTLTGYIFGALIVILMQSVLSHDALTAWGWRIPFLVAGPLGLIGLYVRIHLEESPAYEKAAEKSDKSDTRKEADKGGLQEFKTILVQQWRPLLICIGLVLAFNVTNYMLTGYMPTFIPKHLGIDETPALIIVVIVMAIIALLVTFLGKWSDRVGRKPVMYVGSVLLVVISIPMFLLMFRGGHLAIFLGTLPMGLMLVCFMSTEPSTLPTLFPTNIRNGATAIGFNLSVSAFGGTTPLIASALVEGTGNLFMPAYILIVAGIIGIVSVHFLPEPVGKPLMGSGPTVESEAEARKLVARLRKRRRGHKKKRRTRRSQKQ